MLLADAGRGQFTAAIEVQEQRRLILSFLQHMAVQRLCKNPFEEEEVVGITNYLDIGLQVSFSFASSLQLSDVLSFRAIIAFQSKHCLRAFEVCFTESMRLQVVTNLARGHKGVDTAGSAVRDPSTADLRLGAAWQVSATALLLAPADKLS